MLGLVLLVNLLILSVTALQLYESSKKETEAIKDALSQVETQTNQEWKNTLRFISPQMILGILSVFR